jgi:serine/threonine protein kinase
VRAADLHLKSDIFALGLIYSQFLTGRLPDFDKKKYQYASEAVNSGSALSTSSLPRPFAALISRMLHEKADERPAVDEVFKAVKSPDMPVPEAPKRAPPEDGVLKGRLLKASATSAAAPEADKRTGEADGTGLKGKLVRRKP